MRKCLNCFGEIKNRNAKKFCSIKCFGDYKFSQRKHLKCLVCSEDLIVGQKKFCSHSCSAKHSNSRRESRKKVWLCTRCNATITSGRKGKYCSHNCSVLHGSEIATQEWLDGKRSGYGTHGSTKKIVKRYILNRDDHKCVLCDQGDVWNGLTLTLQVDHIDGNWKNDRPENMRTLCPNCHTQTDTYGSRNKTGNGRSHKRR